MRANERGRASFFSSGLAPSFFSILALLIFALSASALQAQFSTLKIGRGAPGSISTNAGAIGSYSVVGGGEDIFGASDDFTFHFIRWQGNADLRARVEFLEPNAPLTKAGLMLRETGVTNSRMGFVRVTPAGQTRAGRLGANDVRFGLRTGVSSPQQGMAELPPQDFPSPEFPNAWVRIHKAGNILGAYSSVDGLNWILLGNSDTANWEGGAFVPSYMMGIAVSRHPEGPAATVKSEFRNFTLEGQFPPMISDLQNQTIPPGGSTGPLPFLVGDFDTPPDKLFVSGTASNSEMFGRGGITFGGQGNNRTVTATPLPGQTGVVRITVTVGDGVQTASDHFILTVGSENKPPAISDIPDQNLNEDTGNPIKFTVSDDSTSPEKLIVEAISSDPKLFPANGLVLGGAGSDRSLTLTPAPEASGSATITVTVQDERQATALDRFVVTVAPVNDAPAISNIPDQVINQGSSTAPLPFTISDIDDPMANLLVRAFSSDTNLVPQAGLQLEGAGADRTITVRPAANRAGTAIITVSVQDRSQASASDTFNLTVNAVAQRPTITEHPKSLIVSEGESASFTVKASGTPPLSYLWRLNGSDIPGATAETYTIATVQSSHEGVYTVLVSNQGGGVRSDPATLQVRRLDFGDAPDQPYPTTIKNNGARHIIVGEFRLGPVIDPESDGQPNADATGDDISPPGVPDDEDGVKFTTPLISGQPASVEVIAPAGGRLDAWIDFNANGSWADAGEQIFANAPLASGNNALSFSVSGFAKPGRSFARFRLSRQGGLPFFGPASDGEVEDYEVTFIERQEPDPCVTRTHRGRDFWLTFPGNYAPDPTNQVRVSLCITGPRGTTGLVAIPGLGYSTNFTIPATQEITIPLPRAAELGNANDLVEFKGIHVTASAEVSVYGLNQVKYTSDGYLGLPSDVLGRQYLIQAFANVHDAVPELNGTQFALVGCESNTFVTIHVSMNTGSRLRGVPYTIKLNPGETYQLRNTNGAPSDLSGTLIVADKPIAVFGSHQCANVATADPFFCDYLVEQLLPLRFWGNNFVSAPLATRNGDTYRLIAAQDNTLIHLNGSPLVTLDQAEIYQLNASNAVHLFADKPIFVAQYANSSDHDGVTNADPFMLTAPSTRMFLNNYLVCVPHTGFPSNYVNLIVPNGSVGSVQIDGAPVAAAAFAGIPGSGYSAARLPVAPGVHALTGPVPFGASVYGFNEYESYAWPAGLFFGDPIPPTLTCPETNITVTLGGAASTGGNCSAIVPDLRQRVTVKDNCPLQEPVITQTPPPGTSVGPGTHEIIVSVTDAAGNVSRCITIMRVIDNTPITMQCPNDITVACRDERGRVVEFEVIAQNGCGHRLPVTCSPPSGSLFPVGSTEVTCTTTNFNGGTKTCTFRVTVTCQPGGAVSITLTAGTPTLTWSGNARLYSAPTIAGPWTEVAGAASPYSVRTLDRQRFYYVR